MIIGLGGTVTRWSVSVLGFTLLSARQLGRLGAAKMTLLATPAALKWLSATDNCWHVSNVTRIDSKSEKSCASKRKRAERSLMIVLALPTAASVFYVLWANS